MKNINFDTFTSHQSQFHLSGTIEMNRRDSKTVGGMTYDIVAKSRIKVNQNKVQ